MHEPTAGDRARDRITVSGITATGYHGVFEHERRDGQTFVADVTLHVDTRPAAAEDRLDLTVDYGVLSEQVAGVLSGEPADLVETVAERIAAVALSHPGVHAVDVVVHKPQAPVTVPFGDVTVRIHRDRAHAPSVAGLPVVVGGASGLVPDEVPSPEAGELAERWAEPVPAAAGWAPGGPADPTGPDGPRVPEPEPTEATALFVPDWASVEGTAPHTAAPSASHAVAPAGPSAAEAAGGGLGAVAGGLGATAGAAAAGASLAGHGAAAIPAAGHGAGAHAWSPVQPAPHAAPTVAGPGVPEHGAVPTPPPPPPGPAAERTEVLAPAVPAAATTPVPDGPPVDRLDATPGEPVEVVLALGSNIGSSHDVLRQVVRELAETPGVELTAVAPLARTQPVGGPEQPDFLNTVVLARTTLSPRALLAACQRLEDAHGRVRTERWGPRTLDVDIVLYGGVVAVADDLELPHPRAHERAFVLEPWAQVQPDAVLPGLGGGPVAVLAQTAPDRGGIRWMALDWWVTPA